MGVGGWKERVLSLALRSRREFSYQLAHIHKRRSFQFSFVRLQMSTKTKGVVSRTNLQTFFSDYCGRFAPKTCTSLGQISLELVLRRYEPSLLNTVPKIRTTMCHLDLKRPKPKITNSYKKIKKIILGSNSVHHVCLHFSGSVVL